VGKVIPRWKKWLSQITDIRIDRAEISPKKKIDLFLSKGQWKLTSENAIYSYGLFYDNFDGCFKKLSFPKSNIAQVCLLGGGIGSIIELLELKYQQKAAYTFVESIPEVILFFKKYVLPEIKSEVEIQCKDALQFVKESEQKFDLICMDVFEDNMVPLQFQTSEFLLSLNQLLAPSGILIYNQLEENEIQTKQIKEFEKKFFSIFPNNDLISIYTNRMYIAKNN
jgi:2-polyprenyl-3-methyl-5-hydroxy-6-metoxy-1,4-benzoquinol methylase